MANTKKNAVATARAGVVKRFTEGVLLLWESGYWVKNAERRARRDAKKLTNRAIRRSKAANIADGEK